MKPIFTTFFFLVVVLFSTVCPAQGELNISGQPVRTAEIVWIEQAEKGNKVFFSALRGDVWSQPVQLSRDNQNNLGPTVTSGSNDLTVIAWAVSKGAGSDLHYASVKGGVIVTGPVKIDTGMLTNMAPYLAVDHEGVPWLAWSGNNGTTSDVFFSRWENGKWLPPQRVHAENDVPDILPELRVEQDGSVVLKWNTYTRNGSTIVTKTLKKGEMLLPVDTASKRLTDNLSDDPMSCIGSLPIDSIEFAQAVLLTRCQGNSRPMLSRFHHRGK